MNEYSDPEFQALIAGDCPPGVLFDWLLERGVDQHRASETLLPPLVSRRLPVHYVGDVGGYGVGGGSGFGGVGYGGGYVGYVGYVGGGFGGFGFGGGYGGGGGGGYGFGGVGGFSLRAERTIRMEPGKCYMLQSVDWYVFVGRMVRQVGPYEYEFTSASKIQNTNAGDNWDKLAAGDQKARKAASYRHYTTPVFLGVGAVVKVYWEGNTPQEDGFPEARVQ